MHSLDYPAAPGHRGVDTSVEAAEAIGSVAGRLRKRVFAVIAETGAAGATTDEIADALAMPRYSVQPRTTELKYDRRIRDSGQRRRNASGCKAIVWIVEGGAA